MTVPDQGQADGPETRLEAEPGFEVADEEPEPRGTLVLLLLFVLAIAATFTWTYLTLLERS